MDMELLYMHMKANGPYKFIPGERELDRIFVHGVIGIDDNRLIFDDLNRPELKTVFALRAVTHPNGPTVRHDHHILTDGEVWWHVGTDELGMDYIKQSVAGKLHYLTLGDKQAISEVINNHISENRKDHTNDPEYFNLKYAWSGSPPWSVVFIRRWYSWWFGI